MGSFEKLVVATVFFLSAIVLAVSLSSRDGGDAPEAPLGQAVLDASAPPASTPPARAPAAEERSAAPEVLLADAGAGAERAAGDTRGTSGERSRPAPLLSASVEPTREAAPTTPPTTSAAPPPTTSSTTSPAPVSDGALRTRDGLERSPLEGRLLYTWRANDTWTAVAERLYGSGSWADALRVVNDDARPGEGDRVFVLERLGASARETAADPRAPRAAPVVRATGPSDAPVTVTEDGAFVEHVVKSGDTLSSIAERYYGTAARWQRIHDANRDVLKNPDDLVVGTRLKIP